MNSCWLTESNSSSDEAEPDEQEEFEISAFFEWSEFNFGDRSESGGQKTERWSHIVKTQDESFNEASMRKMSIVI